MIRRMPERDDVDFVPQAIIGLPPSHFAGSLGPFEYNFDELDCYEGATFSLNEVLFALRHYKGDPPDTVAIYLDREIEGVGEITQIIHEIMGELKLPQWSLRWERAQGLEFPKALSLP